MNQYRDKKRTQTGDVQSVSLEEKIIFCVHIWNVHLISYIAIYINIATNT